MLSIISCSMYATMKHSWYTTTTTTTDIVSQSYDGKQSEFFWDTVQYAESLK